MASFGLDYNSHSAVNPLFEPLYFMSAYKNNYISINNLSEFQQIV
jgi:hypothetical protein